MFVAAGVCLDGQQLLEGDCRLADGRGRGDAHARDRAGVEEIADRAVQRWLVVHKRPRGDLLLKVVQALAALLMGEIGAGVTHAAVEHELAANVNSVDVILADE